MNWKKMLVGLVYVDFLALTGYALFAESPTAVWEAITHNWWSVQIFVDLCVAATFATVWMWRDAKRHGINPLPYALAVVPTGSVALFAYAMRRPWAQSEAGVAHAAT